MTRRSEMPPHVHGAAFHVREVEFHCATRGRLRAGDLQRPFTAVRSVGLHLDEVLDRCRAYEPLLRPGEAFSHETAAALYGLPLPGQPPQEPPAAAAIHVSSPQPSVLALPAPAAIHVSSPPGCAQARARGVVGHRTSGRLPVIVHRGLPVVPAPLAWCQLAATLAREDLVAIGDSIVTGRRRGTERAPGLASPADLESAVGVWGSGRGARALAWALPRVRVGAESRPETLTRLLLTGARLPEPLLNHPTLVADGRVLHPDLKYPAWRLVFEYEGDGHRIDRRRWQRDIRRHRAFEAAGWRVIRVTSDDLFVEPEGFLTRVREHVAVAGRPSGR